MSNSNNNILTAILTTVVRFDIFDYPLTDLEIWQYLNLKTSYQAVRDALKNNSLLEQATGFYFLPGRREIIKIRQTRYRDTDQKIKTAHQLIRLIIWLPWIRLLCLANVIGAHNLKKDSDLDLFIITKTNRLWLTKLLATIIVALFNLRPTTQHSKNRLCLSFLIDESALDLATCRYSTTDWYFAFWLAGLTPLFGSIEVYSQLIKANHWLAELLPNWRLANPRPLSRLVESRRTEKGLIIGNWLEKLSQSLHKKLLGKALREQQNQSTAVMMTDHLLKLHTLDRRPFFFELAKEKLKKLGI